MDASEKLVEKYLHGQGFTDVAYESDGNVPPDFLVNGTIAIEVRRLNQNYHDGVTNKGLEEDSTPLWMRMAKLLKSLGPPTSERTWFVSYRFTRPLEAWKTLEPKIRNALGAVDEHLDGKSWTILNSNGFELDVFRAGKVYPTKFIMGGSSDAESGGVIVAEMEKNIQLCSDEKWQKIANVHHKYSTWWLALVDHIGFGMSDFDRQMFNRDVSVIHNWDRIIIIDQLDVTRYLHL